MVARHPYANQPGKDDYGASGSFLAHEDATFPPNSSQAGLDPYMTASKEYGGAGGYSSGAAAARRGGKKKWLIIGAVVAAVVILAAVLGGVLGSRASSSNANSVDTSNAADSTTGTSSGSSDASGTSSDAGSSTTNSTSTTDETQDPTSIQELEAWDWSQDHSIGINLGNWLVLEKWMNQDWWVQLGVNSSVDEWTFTEALGDQAEEVLAEHWNTWVTEDDIELAFQHGVNMIRIPVGFWAFIPTSDEIEDEPYCALCGQKEQMERVMEYAYNRSMRVIIDIHGLPGSQNGEQMSGHLTENPKFFNTPVNLNRSVETVRAAMEWIAGTTYRSTVAAIETGNEFRPYTDEQYAELEQFYTDCYDVIQASGYPVTHFIHHAYAEDKVASGNAIDYWKDFATARATSPPSLAITAHPYPGNFPPQTNTADMLSQVCTNANKYTDYPIPVVITEWSLRTGVFDATFEKQFYQSQLLSWSWNGGSQYWSIKLNASPDQLAIGLDYSQYSFETFISNGTDVIMTNEEAGVSNTTTRENAIAYLAAMTEGTNCGDRPANASPYLDSGSFPSWTSGAAQVSATDRQRVKRALPFSA